MEDERSYLRGLCGCNASARDEPRMYRFSGAILRRVDSGLETEMANVAERAASVHPDVKLSRAVFVAYVRERLDDREPAESLARLHVADLYLACGCLHGDPSAWRQLDRDHLSRVPQFVGRIDASPAFSDEVRQRLAEKLMKDANGVGRLTLYTGRGPLGAWLRVTAIREAQTAKRRGKRTVDVADVPLESPAHDPEIQLLKQRFAKEFREAFTSVLATLTADERNVLRLHYLDGLTLEEVGTTYRVSRATAARWIASARETIIERTQAALGTRLGTDAPHAASMLDLVKSQLDLSIQRHFRG
jgi:RNA polymerase sigma-70 factor (ECF subfamily)